VLRLDTHGSEDLGVSSFTAQRRISEDADLNLHHHENFKSSLSEIPHYAPFCRLLPALYDDPLVNASLFFLLLAILKHSP
jgi:hypothetical protein